MIAELLRLRFEDGDVKHKLENAQTKTQTALAWQNCASLLSQSLGVIITREQVSQKYRKLKCIYWKEKQESEQTGNFTRQLREIDVSLWVILHDAFAGRYRISGEVFLDSHLHEEDSDRLSSDAGAATAGVEGPKTTGNKSKISPVDNLANAMQVGMEAIAASLAVRASSLTDELIASLTESLISQHEEARRLQVLQLHLLEQLVSKDK